MAESIDWNRRALLEHNATQFLSYRFVGSIANEGINFWVARAVDWAERIQAEVERRHPESKE